MGIVRRLIRLASWAVGLLAATFIGVAAFTFTYENKAEPDAVDVIVCLGAGMSADGTLHGPAIKRVETCAELYAKGIAPRVHFTGGRRVPDGPAAGDQMAKLAISLGVPDGAISRENESLSTLQNALFSQPMLADADTILIVTEAFHLPRSVTSFRLLGPQSATMYMSEPVRLRDDGSPDWRMLRREVTAIWFNGLRLGAWWLGGIFNIEGRDGWLD